MGLGKKLCCVGSLLAQSGLGKEKEAFMLNKSSVR